MTHLAHRLEELLDRHDGTGVGTITTVTLRRLLEETPPGTPHDCPPMQLVRKFDGGNQAMLCPICRRTLGYDKQGSSGRMPVEWGDAEPDADDCMSTGVHQFGARHRWQECPLYHEGEAE